MGKFRRIRDVVASEATFNSNVALAVKQLQEMSYKEFNESLSADRQMHCYCACPYDDGGAGYAIGMLLTAPDDLMWLYETWPDPDDFAIDPLPFDLIIDALGITPGEYSQLAKKAHKQKTTPSQLIGQAVSAWLTEH